MKKLIALSSALLFIFLCGCNTESDESTTREEDIQTTLPPVEVETVESLTVEEYDPAKVYIAYFSHNDPVEGVAEYIYEKNDGYLHRIETLTEYPDDEKELIKIAAEETRPALKNSPSEIHNYDIVFLCFPAWNNTMPKALWTFIEDFDLRDKAIIPICYGSQQQLQNAMRDMRILNSEMMIVDGFSFTDDFLSVSADFDIWLNNALFG